MLISRWAEVEPQAALDLRAKQRHRLRSQNDRRRRRPLVGGEGCERGQRLGATASARTGTRSCDAGCRLVPGRVRSAGRPQPAANNAERGEQPAKSLLADFFPVGQHRSSRRRAACRASPARVGPRRRSSGRRVHLGKRQSGSGLRLGQHFADRSGARQRAANHFFCLGKQGSAAGRQHDRGIAARADTRSRGWQHRAPMGPERPGRGPCLGARTAGRRRKKSRAAERSLELGTNGPGSGGAITSPLCRPAKCRRTP